MKKILAAANLQVLEEFVGSNVLLAFDYDGTLAPIVSNPEAARMRQETRGLLSQLTTLYPVIVISGRAQPDALRRVRGCGLLEVIGNHGIDPRHAAKRHIAAVGRWLLELNERLTSFKGLMIEDKVYSVAIHYRHSREKKLARAAILEAAAALDDVRIIGGKQVVNVLPKDAPHKGIALERERDRLGCDTALYVGDDETDEDVFSLDQPGRLLGIRVGSKQSSAASYCIDTQRAVDDLLRSLLRFRRSARQGASAAR
jgi:trehalose 6-phosphate phosphatase